MRVSVRVVRLEITGAEDEPGGVLHMRLRLRPAGRAVTDPHFLRHASLRFGRLRAWRIAFQSSTPGLGSKGVAGVAF